MYKDKKQIAEFLNYIKLFAYVIREDLTVDTYESVSIKNCPNLGEVLKVQFGTVEGSFDCSNNEKLNSIVGFPKIITGNVFINFNPNLNSIKDWDGYIKGNIQFLGNPEMSLENDLINVESKVMTDVKDLDCFFNKNTKHVELQVVTINDYYKAKNLSDKLNEDLQLKEKLRKNIKI